MSEFAQIGLTTLLTVISGVVLFIIGEFLRVLVINPLQKYKEQVQLCIDRVDYYANRITNFFSNKPGKDEAELMRTIENDMRSAATQLRSKYGVIGCNKTMVKMGIIPSKSNVEAAVSKLLFVSNNLVREGSRDDGINHLLKNSEAIDEIKDMLAKRK